MTPEQRLSIALDLVGNPNNEEYNYEEKPLLNRALRTAQLAKSDGADEETILAALFVNSGNLIPSTKQRSDIHDKKQNVQFTALYDHDNIANDDFIGASFNWSELGFSSKTRELAESNVLAKRYLSTVDPAYQDSLSSASKESLKLQGGATLTY